MDQPDNPGRATFEFERMIGLVTAGALSQAIAVAAELGIADLLAGGPRSAAELAGSLACHAPSLHRLLRALASVDVCVEREDGTFALTAAGSLLGSDADGGFRSYMTWWGKYRWPVWGNLLHSVQTGERAAAVSRTAIGMMELDLDPAAAATFHGAMADVSGAVASGLVHGCNWAGVENLVDVGGGHGELLATILAAHPDMQGVLFDQPHASEGARRNFARAGVGARCAIVCGDFFEAVPQGADALLLKSIIHDWNDERSAVILGNCRKALGTGGRLILVEQVMPIRFAAFQQQHAAVQDLNMLVMLAGRERTSTEFGSLLSVAGFAVTTITPTALDYHIIEAVAI